LIGLIKTANKKLFFILDSLPLPVADRCGRQAAEVYPDLSGLE
jgi:hypothetical protein